MIGFGVAFVCSARSYADGNWRCNGGAMCGQTFDEYLECLDLCTGECHNMFWRQLSTGISYAYFQILGEHWLGVQI